MSTALAILPKIWATQASPETLALVSNDTPSIILKPAPRPEFAFYRKYTEAMLRRYMRFSMEAGRVPSLLGQEMFRGKVTSYRVRGFDDVVNFVHDVERCIGRLEPLQQKLIHRIAVQEFTQGETAAILRMSLSTVIRRYNKAIDNLTEIFLEVNLLEPLQACQEGGRRSKSATS